MSKRAPTDQEVRDYKYMVDLSINVTRTDKAMLTADENGMVLEMKKAAEDAIKAVMIKHGNEASKNLGSDMRIY